MKKGLALFLLLVFISVLSGCTVAKGTAYGVAYGSAGLAKGAAEGVVDDYNIIMGVDRWIKKNLW